jgi:hypothetical protein
MLPSQAAAADLKKIEGGGIGKGTVAQKIVPMFCCFGMIDSQFKYQTSEIY